MSKKNIEHILPNTQWCVVSSFPPFGLNMRDISTQFLNIFKD